MLVVETGVGVAGANAYVSTAWVTEYLTARNRQTENGWDTVTESAREAAIIEGAEYIEKRFARRFRGRPSYKFESSFATAEITFSGIPLDGETLILGDEVWTFVAVLSGSPREVPIGADAAATAANLSAALGGGRSRHATAASAGPLVALAALAPGAGGAFTRLSGTVSNAAITPFAGGVDGGTQNLSWPRFYCYDRHGTLVEGVPDLIRRANAEYTVRSLAAPLIPDPSDEAAVKRRLEKVGPIEEETEYQSDSSGPTTFPRYPAVDRMLTPLLVGWGGGVIRG